MDRILLSTVVHREPETVFPYLQDFTNYPTYAKHLESVDIDGDGGPGTAYDLHLKWWKLRYTAKSRVTVVDEPASLRWELRTDIDARGEWRVEPLERRGSEESTAADPNAASRVYFEAVYDPHSADEDVVSLPRFVSMGWVIDKLRPRLMDEARRVLERLVEDIEGQRREVELTVHEMP